VEVRQLAQMEVQDEGSQVEVVEVGQVELRQWELHPLAQMEVGQDEL
jgi:hypothetical protein